MQKNAPATRRIDLSNCKLLSTYGRNPADSAKNAIKVGAFVKGGLVKSGRIIKPASL